jgi:biopolymer transport protein ExbD
MAFKLNHADEGEMPVNHEINVTPFIDVMLVLLIIFMVAAPLATVDSKVDLPASTAQVAAKPDKPVFLTVKADRNWVLGEQPVTAGTLAAALDALCHGDRDQRVYLRADKSVDYDTLMKAMNGLRAAGYLKVGLVGLESGGSS